VNTGSVSANRPSVTSMMCWSATRASRMRRSGCGPGWAQASQAESGDQDSPPTTPSSDAASSVTCPDATSMSSSLPSCAAAATVAPSGEAVRSITWPSWPSASRTVSTSGSPVTEPISSASAPAASVTQTACPVSPRTRGSRARAAGLTCRARAGPSLCVSQCTVPRTSTTLA